MFFGTSWTDKRPVIDIKSYYVHDWTDNSTMAYVKINWNSVYEATKYTQIISVTLTGVAGYVGNEYIKGYTPDNEVPSQKEVPKGFYIINSVSQQCLCSICIKYIA